MSITIYNGPFSLVAKQDGLLHDDVGLNVDNCAIVYEVFGSYRSWVPGRDINSFDSIVTGRGYIIIPLAEVDLSSWFADGSDIGSNLSGALTVVNQSGAAAKLIDINNPETIVLNMPANGIYTFRPQDLPEGVTGLGFVIDAGTYKLYGSGFETNGNLVAGGIEEFISDGETPEGVSIPVAGEQGLLLQFFPDGTWTEAP